MQELITIANHRSPISLVVDLTAPDLNESEDSIKEDKDKDKDGSIHSEFSDSSDGDHQKDSMIRTSKG